MNEEDLQRKLTAIMFTDIVGYSKMMGADEEGTMAFLNFHNALMRDEIAKNGGHVIKTVGDAFLADFNSAVNAVRCAVSIQKRFLKHNQATGRNQQVRIGIHIGDVVISNNDIFGDGVNIAARLQPIAEPGGMCISQDVYNHIKNKVEFHTVSLGPKELKNIAQKVSIYKIVMEVLDDGAKGKKKPAGIVPYLIFTALAAMAGGAWYFYGQGGNSPKTAATPAALAPQASPASTPVAAPAATPTAVPVPTPTAVPPLPKAKPSKKTKLHHAAARAASTVHGRVFYNGQGAANVYGSDEAANANNKLDIATGQPAVYHFDSGTAWGCGMSIPPDQGPFLAMQSVDLSAYDSLRVTALVPAGLKFAMRVEEAGCDKPGQTSYNGVNGTDGECYQSETMAGTGEWHEYVVKLSQMARFAYWGNQNGNQVLDRQAIKMVDILPAGNQGMGDIQVKSIVFFKGSGSSGEAIPEPPSDAGQSQSTTSGGDIPSPP